MNQIYVHLGDIRHQYLPISSDMIHHSTSDSLIHNAYCVVIEQARTNFEWNSIRNGRNNDLSKVLPYSKTKTDESIEELELVSLDNLLHSSLNLNFVQLFETASLDEIELDYKNNIGRQFIVTPWRKGGIINESIPCLLISQFDYQTIFIPSEIKTQRLMTK